MKRSNLLRTAIFMVFLALTTLAVYAINVTLESPADSELFLNSNDISFNCSVSDVSGITNITLYNDINGSWAQNATRHFGFEVDAEAEDGVALLMHFNNDSSEGENSTFVYDWSGNSNHGQVINVSHTAIGKFGGAFRFTRGSYSSLAENESIEIADSDSLDLTTKGTVEFWINVSRSSGGYDLILTKGDSDDHLSPYALWLLRVSGQLKLIPYFGDGLNIQAVQTNDDLSLNQWHHIAYTWNSSNISIYVDGVYNTSAVQTVIPFNSGRVLRIGRHSQGYYFNGTIDELALYNRALTPTEIAIHAGVLLSNSTSANWTVRNVPDKSYTWNCQAYNASDSNFSITNYTFTMDKIPPLFESVKNTPDDSDAIDPGITINITANVSDINNISSVILQYKSPSATKFTNITMSNSTADMSNSTFNASFTASVNGNWTYRIFANTTNNKANTSSETNLSVEFDYTWNATRSFGIVAGNLLETRNIGNITINNTGDFTLNFDLSDNSPNGITYNISEPFDLAAGDRIVIATSTTFSGSIREDAIAITIAATTLHANPSSLTANATLLSTSGGAFLFNTLVSYPTTVNQSGSINLSGSVRNIGNETALNTNLSWILPSSAWINASGNLTQQIGNLTEDSVEINNVTINVSPSVSAGSYTIYLNSTCSNNVTSCSDSESFTLTVSCSNTDNACGAGCTYLTDSDCTQEVVTVTIGGGGGGNARAGGSAIEILVKPEEINISQIVELVRGGKNIFEINVTNTFPDSVLENLTLHVTGFPLQYLTITPDLITNLGYLQTRAFTVIVTSPAYKGYEEHLLNATVTGMLIKTFKVQNATATSTNPFTLKNYISLIIHEISKEKADASIEAAIKNLEEMQKAGFPVKKPLKLLEEAKETLANGRFKLAQDISEQIAGIRSDAFSASTLMEDVESKIAEAEANGLLIIETKKLLNMALAAFEREDFETAIKRAKDAQLSAIIETKGKINILKFLQQYRWALLAAFAITAISSYLLRKRIEAITITRRLEDLSKEAVSINQLMGEAQTNTFKEKTISTTEYHKLMYQYENRLSEIRQLQAKLRSRKAALIRISDEISRLNQENEAVIESSKNAQNAYYNEGTLSKKKYARLADEYKLRRIEIEKAIAMLEAKLAKKEKLDKLKGTAEKIDSTPKPENPGRQESDLSIANEKAAPSKLHAHSRESILNKLKEVYHHGQR